MLLEFHHSWDITAVLETETEPGVAVLAVARTGLQTVPRLRVAALGPGRLSARVAGGQQRGAGAPVCKISCHGETLLDVLVAGTGVGGACGCLGVAAAHATRPAGGQTGDQAGGAGVGRQATAQPVQAVPVIVTATQTPPHWTQAPPAASSVAVVIFLMICTTVEIPNLLRNVRLILLLVVTWVPVVSVVPRLLFLLVEADPEHIPAVPALPVLKAALHGSGAALALSAALGPGEAAGQRAARRETGGGREEAGGAGAGGRGQAAGSPGPAVSPSLGNALQDIMHAGLNISH